MRPQTTEGKGGFCRSTEAVLTQSSQNWRGGYGLITKKGTNSHFDSLVDAAISGGQALGVGMPVYIPAFTDTSPLSEGDEVQPWDLDLSCWITDAPLTKVSQEVVDMTTQCDRIAGRRRKELAKNTPAAETGTITGFVETESDDQRILRSAFLDSVIQDGGHATYLPARSKVDPEASVVWFWDRTCDPSSEVGEPDEIQFRKLLVTSFTDGGTGTGGRPFAFDYETLETYRHRLDRGAE